MRFSLFSYIMLCIMCVCPGVASAAETAVPSGVTPLPNGITIKSGEYTLPGSGATFYIKGSSQHLLQLSFRAVADKIRFSPPHLHAKFL